MVGSFKLVVSDAYAARSLAFTASALNLVKSGAIQLHSLTQSESMPTSQRQVASLSGEWGTFSEFPTIAKAIGALKDQTAPGKRSWNGTEPMEKAKVAQWLSFSYSQSAIQQSEEYVRALDKELTKESYLAGSWLTVSDLVAYWMAHPIVKALGAEKCSGYPNVCRWFDQVQHEVPELNEDNSAPEGQPEMIHFPATEPLFPALDVALSTPSPQASTTTEDKSFQKSKAGEKGGSKDNKGNPEEKGASKESKKDERQNANDKGEQAQKQEGEKATNKKQKKEKKAENSENSEKKKGEAADEITITACEFKVGHIKKVWKHPEAEKLYCEEIDVGEEDPRQIASGLVEHMPMEQLENRKVIVVANLKPRPLVGFKSHGMVLCATSPDKSKVELLEPPKDAPVGERVQFPGYEGEAASPKWIQKKKALEYLLPQLKVRNDGVACWKDVPFTTSAGPVLSGSLKEGTIS
eukprot:gb/GECG01006864.1/.p1 GENE.gb/GECG01006864.1/~~gb/GECG01006864.1/.p1  ORF type:complete len:466 (+),score=82.13 gb/GECG01006864.1/:1-1398(+)